MSGTVRGVPIATFLSFRLGGTDGVSVEAQKWAGALTTLGFSTRRVAGAIGDGARPEDLVIPGLAIDPPAGTTAPEPDDLVAALRGSALVVVENLCSLPLNLAAADAATVALVKLAGDTNVLLHHHDLPWQRPAFAGVVGYPPPIDALHVTINDLSRRELAARGIDAVVVRNCFDLDARPGDRDSTRAAFGFARDELVVLQPARAIHRKNVPAALRLAERLDGRSRGRAARYWLTGPAEDGYAATLDELLAGARVPVSSGLAPTPADGYAAADVIAFPSTWEGFGNPLVESVVARRPAAVGHYPVLDELTALGFRFFAVDDPDALVRWLDQPDDEVFVHNLAVARAHCSLDDLPARLATLLTAAGCLP